MVKNLLVMPETQIRSLGWENPQEKGMATHSVFLPGESHGQRSLEGYHLRGRKESDTTQRLQHHRQVTPDCITLGPLLLIKDA